MACRTLERMPDPPADVRKVPAKWVVDDGGVDREHVFKDDNGMTIMVPEYDPIMEDFVMRHGHDMPDTAAVNYIKPFEVDQKTYENVDVITEIKKELEQQTGEFFEEQSYYRDEAARCYNAHGNPTTDVGCSDFLDESKTIGSKELPPKHRVFLCHMCPYMQSEVATQVRLKQGLYTPDKARRRRRRRL